MLTTSKSPSVTSFLGAVRAFRATPDSLAVFSAASPDCPRHRVTREEIATLFSRELGYNPQI